MYFFPIQNKQNKLTCQTKLFTHSQYTKWTTYLVRATTIMGRRLTIAHMAYIKNIVRCNFLVWWGLIIVYLKWRSTVSLKCHIQHSYPLYSAENLKVLHPECSYLFWYTIWLWLYTYVGTYVMWFTCMYAFAMRI